MSESEAVEEGPMEQTAFEASDESAAVVEPVEPVTPVGTPEVRESVTEEVRDEVAEVSVDQRGAEAEPQRPRQRQRRHKQQRRVAEAQKEQQEHIACLLREIVPDLRVDESLRDYCSFKIGGPADYYAEPEDEAQLVALIREAARLGIPTFFLGEGSNLLVSDMGIRGLVIHLGAPFSRVQVLEGEDLRSLRELSFEPMGESLPATFDTDADGRVLLQAGAGISLRDLALEAQRLGLSGLEFCHGIPGSLGGAVFMNAGAYGGQFSDRVVAVQYLDEHGDLRMRDNAASNFGYRHSYYREAQVLVTSVILAVEPGDPQAIQAEIDDLWNRRQHSQPLEYPSAGSIFKRPEGYYAGKLISDSGLKGCRIGGAEVSKKHAGFIVNPQHDATARDVYKLVKHIQETVYAEFGVHLELELRLVGDWGGLEETL